MKATCMNCKFYKVEDGQSGYCRSAGRKEPDGAKKTMVRHDHVCPLWADCGQNYYIRLGWLKAQAAKTGTARQ